MNRKIETTMIEHKRLHDFVGALWDDEVIPTLVDYIRIPNKSPAFEPDWENLGHMDRAVDLFVAWTQTKLKALPGATVTVERLPGRTPVIFIDIPAAEGVEDKDKVVLLYGHLDKQPEMFGWADGKGPWIPVIQGDKLYGRGGADDGYALFGSLGAVLALRDQQQPHGRIVILIEASEESGSPDLPHYVEMLADRIGTPSLVICLDSGCGDYDRLWLTTSLRGLLNGTLRVEILKDGVHSGDASGIVPSSFRIMRQVIARLEDGDSGAVLPDALHAQIPAKRREEAKIAADALGDSVYTKFPFVTGAAPVLDDRAELVLNRTWRPALSTTGLGGAPAPDSAGNVMRPYTEAKLSIRLPPTVDAAMAGARVKALLEADPPYGAHVSFVPEAPSSGWDAPELAPWLTAVLQSASRASFGQPMAMMGEGGSIPFIAALQENFPEAQFLVTGLLGPHSNAHGPNEFLHIPTGKRLTEVVAHVLHACA